LDSAALRAAIRLHHPDEPPPVRYLDSDGIPPRFQLRNVPGEAVPPSVRKAMEGNPAAPWETRDNMLAALGSSAAPEERTLTLRKTTNQGPAPPVARPPMTRLQRDALLIEGDREARNPDLPLGDRCAGLRKVIESHFERSREAWESSRRLRPGLPPHGYFHEFAASWLAANSDRRDGPFADLGPVVEQLRKEFPAPETPRIAARKTYWGSR
jgi:hypothetical protein